MGLMVQVETCISTITTEGSPQSTKASNVRKLVSRITLSKFVTFLGSFVVTKSRPSNNIAMIHSKPVNYTNNGGGRDTYISDSAGGLKTMYQPAGYKRTFYNNLRNYPQLDNPAKKGKSHTANREQKMDLFTKSQDHWNTGFRKEMRLISNYQNMLDDRLSKPKLTQKTKTTRQGGE